MSLNKKVLAVAIATGLFAPVANATVYLSGSAASASDPVSVSNEIKIGTSGTTITNAANVLDLEFQFRYNFSIDEVRYARVECDSGVRFVTGNTVGDGSTMTSTPDYGSINGLNSSAITFSVTATGGPVQATDRFVIAGNRSLRTNTGNISCSYSLYDTPSQAAAGGTDGRITTVSGTYISFNPSLALTTNPNVSYADVEADPVFSLFTEDATNAIAAGDTAQIGGFSWGLVSNVTTADQPIWTDGAASAMADLLTGNTYMLVEGDFTAAVDSTEMAWLDWDADCSNPGSYTMYTYDDYAIYYTGTSQYLSYYVCFQADGETAIPASEYMTSFITTDATAASVPNYGPKLQGEIRRNGTELQAPLAQLPEGWLSRMVLTNTGSLDRPYFITVQGEEGNTIDTDNLTGTIPAGTTVVVDLNTVMTGFSGSPRGTIVTTVAGPNNQIQGLYQIVNPASGSISNHVMVRPGSN